MSGFEAWIGREAQARDQLSEALARRWCAAFDLPVPDDGIMPQGIHFALCTPETRSCNLGEDGHPARNHSLDSFLPPLPLPRRMWASSAIEFHAPIAIGAAIERTSRVASVSEKDGSTGPLAFVDIAHQTRADGVLAVKEVQTLVYREAAAPDAPLSPPPSGDAGNDGVDVSKWDGYVIHRPDEALLFRYSALTFNSHRIHYDAPYAREVERYRGLVVHGPLTASLLLQLAARELGENALRSFEFRGVSPAIVNEALITAIQRERGAITLDAFARDGRAVMKASAKV